MSDRNITQAEKESMPDMTFFKSDSQSVPTKTVMSDKQGILAEITTKRETKMPTKTCMSDKQGILYK